MALSFLWDEHGLRGPCRPALAIRKNHFHKSGKKKGFRKSEFHG
jgi:hypothetical protein